MQHSVQRWSARAAVGVAAIGSLAALSLPAMAASPHGQTVTETTNQHGTWVETGDTDFCTGAPVSPTITGNEVNHFTYFTESDEVWGTFTEEGHVSATIGGVLYTGRITVWGNYNLNERNSNQTFTQSVNLSGSDGSTEVGHEVSHVTFDAVTDQPVVSFDKMYITCS